ncbi:MAG: hypothetical protein IJC89_05155 [Clostridia bacterium]|nr:hypothetical protein [Clostridia bacterium]
MIFAKYINENTIILCPRNGYIQGKAISNIHRFFKKNPDSAKREGYMELISLNNNIIGKAKYSIENNKIFERVEENDS